MKHKTLDQICGVPQSTAYRGYYIQAPRTDGYWRVSKDGFHICSPNTLADAKRQIDELTGE